MAYFEKEDVLHLEISDSTEGGSIELAPNITAELNDDGELIGIEIPKCQRFHSRFDFGIRTSKDTLTRQSSNRLTAPTMQFT